MEDISRGKSCRNLQCSPQSSNMRFMFITITPFPDFFQNKYITMMPFYDFWQGAGLSCQLLFQPSDESSGFFVPLLKETHRRFFFDNCTSIVKP